MKWEKGQREWLREWVRDGLLVAALDDDNIAESICVLAGLLSRSREPLRKLLKEEMKQGPRWSFAEKMSAWNNYVHYLGEEGGDKKKARWRLIQELRKRTGKELSDGRMANLLSEFANKVPLEDFEEHVQPFVRRHLACGRKTMHRGWK